jgi:uncharacterized protein (TIGR01440 family)
VTELSLELNEITKRVKSALEELLDVAALKPGNIVVIGCSTSEVGGHKIGSNSSMDIAEALMEGILPVIGKHDLYLAVQGCEHINRAIIVEEECAEKYGFEIVNVVPHRKAGGSFSTTYYTNCRKPAAVETIQAHAGLDIGDTFIGMHLKRVAVPVRLSIKEIGKAHVTAARVRPKLIGGERAKYK